MNAESSDGNTNTLQVMQSEFASLTEAWDALIPAGITPFPFVSRAWAEPWWQIFGAGKELLLLSVADTDGSILAVAPLMIENTDDLGRAVRFIGGVDVTDYLDIAARPDHAAQAWQAIIAWLVAQRDHWDTLDFHCIPDASPSRALIADAVARVGNGFTSITVQEEVCPTVELHGGFEPYLAHLAKKYRNEIRRKERNLLRESPDAALHVRTGRDEVLAALPDFFRLHRLSAPDKDRFLTPDVEKFFSAITTSMANAGVLRLYALQMDGEVVAMMYAFVAAGRLLVYNSGFDPSRSETSVGMVLTGMMIADAAGSGLAVCDFLRGNESYKYRFGAVDVPLWRVLAGTNPAALEQARAAMTVHLAVPADNRDQDSDHAED